MIAQKIARELVSIARHLISADTFKCPECGSKVLEQTGYCVKCKKKVKKARDLTAKAPQWGKGKPIWRDIKKGQTFKYKGKEWKKVSKTKAVQVTKELYVRDNVLP